jgi:hypothetical protein
MLIAISGKRGVGKTTAAMWLVRNRGYELVSFGDHLRRLARNIFPFTEADFKDIKKKESPFGKYDWTPRDFLIGFGEFCRYYDKNFWVHKVIDSLDHKKNYVIDDMRFENEFEIVKEYGASTVRINRYEKDNPFGKNLDIVSETALDNHPFDYVVEDCRNTSLRSLHAEMDRIHDDIHGK